MIAEIEPGTSFKLGNIGFEQHVLIETVVSAACGTDFTNAALGSGRLVGTDSVDRLL